MKKFTLVLGEVNNLLSRLFIADRVVESLIVFLGVFFALFFIKFYPGIAIIPGLAYLGITVFDDMKRKKWRLVEEKYKPLHEKLRTAADNVNMENPIVEELQQDVAENLRNVCLSWFVDLKKMAYKIGAIVVLCFLILMIANFDIHWDPFEAYKGPYREFGFGPGGGKGGGLDSDIVAAGEDDDTSIFGKSSVAKLGDKDIRIQINPGGNEINLRDAAEIEEQEFEESFPDEIYAGSSDLYEENLQKDQMGIVKSYFENVAKSST